MQVPRFFYSKFRNMTYHSPFYQYMPNRR